MTQKVVPQPAPEILVLHFAVIILIFVVLAIALWKAAKNDQKYWFSAIFLFGIFTYGIIPLFYLFVFAKHKLKLSEFAFWKKEAKK